MERPPVIVGTDPFSVFVQHRTEALHRDVVVDAGSQPAHGIGMLVDLPVAATFAAISVRADQSVEVRTSDGNHHRADASDHALDVLARALLDRAREDLDAMSKDDGTALPSHRDVQLTVVSRFGRRRCLVDLEQFWGGSTPSTPTCVSAARRLVQHLDRCCSFPLTAL